MNTIELVTLYERGSAGEKFWALVLLLAIKERASHAWYDPAQGDSRLGLVIDGVKEEMVSPEQLQSIIPRAMLGLFHQKSLWGYVDSFFRGRAAKVAPTENSFVAKIGGAEVRVWANCDLVKSSVDLRLSPQTNAAVAADSVLKNVLEAKNKT